MHGKPNPLLAAIPLALAIALGCGLPSPVQAQGEPEKTHWASTMIYPVGDPLDYQQPAPGEDAGFHLSRGLKRGRRPHEGVDLSNREMGSAVRAVAPGLVVTTRRGNRGWGNMVVLAHRLPGGDILFSLFAHLMPGSITVHEGEVVALGQTVGRIGSTGRSTGPHLHLEFRKLSEPLDKLGQPLAEAWERASIIDPLRMFSAMIPADGTPFPLDHLELPSPDDPLYALVQRGALSPTALDRPDDALTRGELYGLALAAIEPLDARLPRRWVDVRQRLLKRAGRFPTADRAPFRAALLPRRESDARSPASLSETVDVLTAVGRVRSEAGGGSAFGPPVGVDRRELEESFPHGLAALDPGVSIVPAAPLPAGEVGPPAVSRRQAGLLWAYLESPRAEAQAVSQPR